MSKNDEKKLISTFEKWEGYNYFPLNGRILFGPCTIKPTLMTSTAITIPVILFLVYDPHYIKKEISFIIPIIISLLYIITLIFLLIASFSDPGILQRYPCTSNIIMERKEVRIVQGGILRNYRFCGSCSIMRPPRSTHCGDCNNCVERFDHHCPWIGNCAGKRNYKFFYIFIVLLNILTVLIGVFCIVHIYKFTKKKYDNNDFEEGIKGSKSSNALSECVIYLFLIVYCALSMIFTTNLLIYHTGLVHSNMTTKEELKRHFHNPFGDFYSRSRSLNWKNVICPKYHKKSILKILKWKDEVKEEIVKNEYSKEKSEKIEKVSFQSDNSENGKGKKVSTASSNFHNDANPDDINVKFNNPEDNIINNSNNANISQDDYADVADTSSYSQRKQIPKFEYKLDMNSSTLGSK